MGWKVAWLVSLALLLFTGGVGIYNAASDWSGAANTAQRSVEIAVFLYGVFGLLTAYGLLRRRRWSLVTAIVWAMSVTFAPGVAVVAYGGADALVGSAIAASAASGLIALGVVWTTHVMTRPVPRPVAVA